MLPRNELQWRLQVDCFRGDFKIVIRKQLLGAQLRSPGNSAGASLLVSAASLHGIQVGTL